MKLDVNFKADLPMDTHIEMRELCDSVQAALELVFEGRDAELVSIQINAKALDGKS